MIDIDTALREELLQIAIRQPEPQIPADRHTITSGGKRNPANPKSAEWTVRDDSDASPPPVATRQRNSAMGAGIGHN